MASLGRTSCRFNCEALGYRGARLGSGLGLGLGLALGLGSGLLWKPEFGLFGFFYG